MAQAIATHVRKYFMFIAAPDLPPRTLLIAGGSVIRRVDPDTQIITTIAGTGVPGVTGDGGLATAAQLNVPSGLTINASSGSVYFAESSGDRIRWLSTQGSKKRRAQLTR
jgi:hypothetical protein